MIQGDEEREMGFTDRFTPINLLIKHLEINNVDFDEVDSLISKLFNFLIWYYPESDSTEKTRKLMLPKEHVKNILVLCKHLVCQTQILHEKAQSKHGVNCLVLLELAKETEDLFIL